jgi:RsiW-degrading membrane proteinase PrsW (M82 family)
MGSLWIPFLLVAVSALPALALAIWFRLVRYPLKILWFLLFLLGGALSILPAAFIRTVFSFATSSNKIVQLFAGVAFSEEAGRLVFLIPVLLIFFHINDKAAAPQEAVYEGLAGMYDRKSIAAAIGCVAGLGFALIETATYPTTALGIMLLRAITSAPLHASCACRVAVSVEQFRKAPLPSVVSFIMAVVLHGVYDLMVLSNGMPLIFPVLLVAAIAVRTVQMINTKVEIEA